MSSSFHCSGKLLLSGVLALTFSLDAPNVMASIFGKSELSGAWKERFLDINKLNEYTQNGLNTDISDVIIKNYKLDGAILINATFRDVEWTESTAENISISNTVFRSNTFNNVEFTGATLSNVTFEDSEFNRTIFNKSTLKDVRFIRCKFKFKSALTSLRNSNVTFDYSTLDGFNFARSTSTLRFSNSDLTKVRLIDLDFPSSLTFENAKLQDIDMDRSKLSKLVMDNVTGGGASGFNGGSIAEVNIRNSDMAFSLSEGTLGKVSYVNSIIESNFSSANIKELQVNNCKPMGHLVLYKTKIDDLHISNCPVNDFRPIEAIIQNFSIDKATIVNSQFMDMKVKNFTLTDVSFDQKNDFSGAQVEHLTTKNITKLPGLILNLTGSNVKF